MNAQPGSFGGAPGAPYVEVPSDVSAWQAPRGILSVGAAFSEAWAVMRANLGTAFLLGFVSLFILWLANGTGFGIFLMGPLVGGTFYAVHRLMLTGRAEVGDLFKGFSVFVPLMVAGLLTSIFMGIGTILCLVPGIIAYFMYQMTYLFILDRRLDFWPAMEASRKLYFANFWSLTLLYLFQGVLTTAGTLACCVGVFFAYPLTEAMTASAYRQLVGFRRQGDYEPEAPMPR